MDIKEKAKMFAIKAHMGQVRKSEPDSGRARPVITCTY